MFSDRGRTVELLGPLIARGGERANHKDVQFVCARLLIVFIWRVEHLYHGCLVGLSAYR